MGLMEIVVPRVMDYAMGAPQRRAEEQRWQTMYGKGGYKERELQLDEKTLDMRGKQLQAQVDQWAEANRLGWAQEKRQKIGDGISLLNTTMHYHPEKAQEVWNKFLKPHLGDADFKLDRTGDWKVKMKDGTAFMIDTNTGEFKTAQYPTMTKANDQIKGYMSGMKAELTRWGGSGGGEITEDMNVMDWLMNASKSDSFQNLLKAKNAGDPEAIKSMQSYEWMLNRIREILGVPQYQAPPQPNPEDAYSPSPYLGTRLGQTGQPLGMQGKPLDEATAREFYRQAGGDPEVARELARQQGYAW